MGIYPSTFLGVMEASVVALVENYELSLATGDSVIASPQDQADVARQGFLN
jgi:hypothetical protein